MHFEVRVLLQALAHLFVDRGHLPRVLARGDDEEVGVGAHRPHVEDDDVARQLVLGDAGDAAGLLERGQAVRSPRRTAQSV